MPTKIVLVGEAWGESEDREKRPFCGASGQELTRMLLEAGIDRYGCFLTNVFNFRPKDNKIEEVCGAKSSALPGYPPLIKSKFVQQKFSSELDRLGDELIAHDPNVVVALGNTPMWALLGRAGISKLRGTTHQSTHTAAGFKVLPTYHPAAVVREWTLRPTVILDFQKALRESEYPDIRRPRREVYIAETIEDIQEFQDAFISNTLAVDIETSGNQITCIGFAPSPEVILVIPIYDSRRAGRNYWLSADDECKVWEIISSILLDATISKSFQNGLYDIAFLWRSYGIKVMGAEHDTMLLHHSLMPEALKGLGFLGSIYTDERAWKEMRGSVDTIKQDE